MQQIRSLTFHEYGGPSVVDFETLDIDAIPTSEILVAVKASGINALDWKIRNGNLTAQDGFGFPKRLGCEFSGVVVEAGEDFQNFKSGAEVFGWLPFDRLGAHADFVLVPGRLCSSKPRGISFAEAAALPMTGATALRCLLDEIETIKGKNILINGGSGSVGSFAVQIAKLNGAYVTATAGSENQELLKELRADRRINYQETDVRKEEVKYDIILDTSNQLPWSEAEPLLAEQGTYLDLQPSLGTAASSFVHNIFSNKTHDMMGVTVSLTDLVQLCDLVEQRGLRVVVGREFPLEDHRSVYQQIEAGEITYPGKAVFVTS